MSDEEKTRFQALAESAWWGGRSDMDSIDDLNDEVMRRILVQRPYISKFWGGSGSCWGTC